MINYICRFAVIMAATFFLATHSVKAEKRSISVIVGNENPIQTLSLEDVRSYFLKQKKSFPKGKSIVPLQKDTTSVERQIFDGSALGMSESKFDAYWIERKQLVGDYAPQEIPTDAAMIALVELIDGSIGYVDSRSLDAMTVHKVKVVATLGE